MYYYSDTATGVVSQKYTTLELDGYAKKSNVPTDNTDYNEGFAKRILVLLTANAINNVAIPLNRYGFF